MPQMAPLNWLMLFMYFILLFLMFCIMNYSFINYSPTSSKIKKLIKNMNWKW
uniref:ATP synthase complex subunit 8 n=1 Tax=Scirtidae sp. BMNH 1274304 TaxID=1796542 RepID=A0A126TFA1_9COLE|nr:ATP synthase F0 subunit 8 [Scirtidae sp. BMNH 1274304]